ncbi:MAG TPA: SRPBCC domain-containing protein [Candidatus Saccharimonadales bacterium]|nr:SRPBCC domain-containing protein [Candidatus Saccharimonadales bacterium]
MTYYIANQNTQDIVWSFTLNSPVERVYAAYINPELIPKWWIQEDTELRVLKMDVRPGGEWIFAVGPEDNAVNFRGVYHTVVPNERIVNTWQFEPGADVLLETVTFEEQPDGKTKVTEQMVFQSSEARDAMIASGMDEASSSAMGERLEKLL